MKKKIAFALAVIIFGFVFFMNVKTRQDDVLSYTVFHSTNGWGYNILVKGNIIIHQDIIPGRETVKGFYNEKQAEKAARLVISKISSHRSPSITEMEMKSIIKETQVANEQGKQF